MNRASVSQVNNLGTSKRQSVRIGGMGPANEPAATRKAPKNLLKVEDPLPVTFDVAGKEKDRKPN